jgi:hypothetical protein
MQGNMIDIPASFFARSDIIFKVLSEGFKKIISFSTVNSLVASWAAGVPVHGTDEYHALITNTLQTGTWIAFLLIAGGLLIGIIGYFRKG